MANDGKTYFYLLRGTRDDNREMYWCYDGLVFTDEAHVKRERDGAAQVYRGIAFDVIPFATREAAEAAARSNPNMEE